MITLKNSHKMLAFTVTNAFFCVFQSKETKIKIKGII